MPDPTQPPDPARLAAVRAQLYRGDPAEFVSSRTELARAARADGNRPLATAIAALRKPSVSAFLLNRWAADDPAGVADLAGLGGRFRDAGTDLDPAELRELTARRRRLVDRSVAQVFEVNGVRAPSEAARQEIAATLNAAVADPAVAERLAQACLERPVEWEGGFGMLGGGHHGPPMLTLVHSAPPRPARRGPAARQQPLVTDAGPATTLPSRRAHPARDRLGPAPQPDGREPGGPGRSEPESEPESKPRTAEHEAARRADLNAARTALTEADRAVRRAQTAQRDRQAALNMAQRRLSEVKADLDRATKEQKDARNALGLAERERTLAQAEVERLR